MTSSMLALLCVGWFAIAAAWSVHAPAPYALEDAELLFEQFIKDFSRNYTDENEKHARFQIFKGNLERIIDMNKKSKHAVYGITQFSDRTQQELESKLGFLGSYKFDTGCTYVQDSDIKYKDAPESWDWREHDAVTHVKDQLTCGSCYAFSAIGNVEGQYAIKHKKLVTLSEQQIVDCDRLDAGCGGGYMSLAIRSLIKQGGSESDEDYAYEGKVGSCTFDSKKVKVQVADCRSYNLTSQEKLKQLLYDNGPLAIGIKGNALFNYHKGLVDDHDCDEGELNHGVLLVGYGSENDTPYWIVKNSWGTKFGESGYFRMHRGENYHSCGMMNDAMASAIVA